MLKREVEEKVIQIVAEVVGLPVEKLSLENSFKKDLGADSLMIYDIMTKCEDSFKVSISDEETENIKTIQDSIEYIHKSTSK